MAFDNSNKPLRQPMPQKWAGSASYAVDLFGALKFLWFRRVRIAIWGVAGFVFSLLLAFYLCTYGATVRLMPPDNHSAGSLAGLVLPSIWEYEGVAGLLDLETNLLETNTTGTVFVKVLQSRTVEDALVRRFDLRQRYREDYVEDAREKLASNTSVVQNKNNGLISITVSDRDPHFAALLASAYVEELDRVLSQVDTAAAGRERSFIETRIAGEKKELDAAQRRFSQFSSKTMVLDIPRQTRVAVEASARLQGQLIAAEAQLQGLQQIYAPEHTRVRTVQARIAELERNLAEMNSGSNKVPEDSGKAVPSIKSLPVTAVAWTDLYRDIKIRETVCEMLMLQDEVARIDEARQLRTVKVLDAATVPELRHPGFLAVALVSTIVSALLSCAGILLQRRWRTWSFDDPRRVLVSKLSIGQYLHRA